MLCKKKALNKGFSLIELMVTNTMMIIVFAVVITMFIANKHKLDYESNKSVRLSQLSFASKEITKAIRSKLSYPWTHIETLEAATSVNATTQFAFKAYDPYLNPSLPYSALRKLIFKNNQILFSRQTGGREQRLLDNVTYFKIFDDFVTPRTGFTGIPKALPNKTLKLPNGVSDIVHSYTVLIEVSIPTLSDSGANNKDVLSNSVTGKEKRIWRYYQMYPENGNIF